jgi:hypothetical protein
VGLLPRLARCGYRGRSMIQVLARRAWHGVARMPWPDLWPGLMMLRSVRDGPGEPGRGPCLRVRVSALAMIPC